MAQTGDPTGTGTGGSGQKIKAEFTDEPHVRGTVSMARAQNPDSADSQFFICFADAAFLNGQYTVWGRVVEGDGGGRCDQEGRSQRQRQRDRPRQDRQPQGRRRHSGLEGAAIRRAPQTERPESLSHDCATNFRFPRRLRPVFATPADAPRRLS